MAWSAAIAADQADNSPRRRTPRFTGTACTIPTLHSRLETTVSELDRLMSVMMAFPEEETARAMYVDELMSQTGCTRLAAETDARCHWHPARQSQRIGRAVALIMGTGATARRLQWHAHRAVRRPIAMVARILVTAGSIPPTASVDQELWDTIVANEQMMALTSAETGEQVEQLPREPYILVGADWVLARAAEWGFISEPVRMYEPEDTDEE